MCCHEEPGGLSVKAYIYLCGWLTLSLSLFLALALFRSERGRNGGWVSRVQKEGSRSLLYYAYRLTTACTSIGHRYWIINAKRSRSQLSRPLDSKFQCWILPTFPLGISRTITKSLSLPSYARSFRPLQHFPSWWKLRWTVARSWENRYGWHAELHSLKFRRYLVALYYFDYLATQTKIVLCIWEKEKRKSHQFFSRFSMFLMESLRIFSLRILAINLGIRKNEKYDNNASCWE